MSRIEDLVQQWYVTKDAHHQIYRQNCQRWALPHTLHDKAVWLRQESLALGLSLQAESRLLACAAALLEAPCAETAPADGTAPDEAATDVPPTWGDPPLHRAAAAAASWARFGVAVVRDMSATQSPAHAPAAPVACEGATEAVSLDKETP